jgi:NAD(P)-dependent dehydrogenase (short-subunit alcohol dehydrogenase family)
MHETILITGAGSGIGRGVAFELARRGHNVIASTESAEQAADLKASAQQEGIKLRIEKLDIRDAEDRARAEEWDVDVLVNNAAIAQSGPLAEIPLDLVRANFETNVFGTVALTQGIVKGMMKKGSGKIIIVSSVAGRMTAPYLGVYCMTKHALEAAAEVLHAELGPHNITVVVVEPGPYATGFNERMMETKYAWYGKNSLFAGDAEAVKGVETWVLGNQYDPAEVIETLAGVVEDPAPEFRICIPKEWEDKIHGILCGEK